MRGYHVMVRYDNRPEATAEAIDEKRWLHTGDLAMMDEQGYVSITGRLKDVVIRGGENLYPREIEEFIHGLPMVSDVYVVGVPDRKMGEEVLAFVKLREGHAAPTPEEFRALCRGHIAHYKIPRYWLVVDEFPMTVTGKVQKFSCVSRAWELGLGSGRRRPFSTYRSQDARWHLGRREWFRPRRLLQSDFPGTPLLRGWQ